MEYIKAYVYNTEIEVNNALSLINSTLGIPKTIDSVTQTYTTMEFNNSKYIIIHDETIEGILGIPSDFEYVAPIIDNPFI